MNAQNEAIQHQLEIFSVSNENYNEIIILCLYVFVIGPILKESPTTAIINVLEKSY